MTIYVLFILIHIFSFQDVSFFRIMFFTLLQDELTNIIVARSIKGILICAQRKQTVINLQYRGRLYQRRLA